ncbi:MAG TPA: hypothetical protein VG457_05455, partial [Planctomycetota bacterium]|nr:hypothetical protein [Planctomycetota bacterium]
LRRPPEPGPGAFDLEEEAAADEVAGDAGHGRDRKPGRGGELKSGVGAAGPQPGQELRPVPGAI